MQAVPSDDVLIVVAPRCKVVFFLYSNIAPMLDDIMQTNVVDCFKKCDSRFRGR